MVYRKAELIRNEHVGNEWAHGVWLGDDRLQRGQQVRLTAGTTYSLSLAAAETNEKYNDRHDETIELTPAMLAEVRRKGGFHVDVTITEHNGRYAGGRATWRFYFSVE